MMFLVVVRRCLAGRRRRQRRLLLLASHDGGLRRHLRGARREATDSSDVLVLEFERLVSILVVGFGRVSVCCWLVAVWALVTRHSLPLPPGLPVADRST